MTTPVDDQKHEKASGAATQDCAAQRKRDAWKPPRVISSAIRHAEKIHADGEYSVGDVGILTPFGPGSWWEALPSMSLMLDRSGARSSNRPRRLWQIWSRPIPSKPFSTVSLLPYHSKSRISDIQKMTERRAFGPALTARHDPMDDRTREKASGAATGNSAALRKREPWEPPRIVSTAIKDAEKQSSNIETLGDDVPPPNRFGPS